MPLVSVVMPVYNREVFVAEAIESILEQTFTDFEFIIVDDGSRDRSAAIIRDYESRDDRIRFLALEQNSGTAAAKNHGIEVATGQYIAGMDSDDVSLPQRLEKQVNFLRANPHIGVVGTCAPLTNEDLKPFADYRVPERHPHIAYNILLGRPVVGASLLIRRDVLDSVGGYELSRKRGEDIELVSRLICRTRFANLPEGLYLYRKHNVERVHMPTAAQDWDDLMRRLLCRLWGEAPQASLDRMARVQLRDKLGWSERRLLKRDLKRYIESLTAAKWIEEADRPYLIALMNRQLERSSPRLWQMLCHWRRHHLAPGKGRGRLNMTAKPAPLVSVVMPVYNCEKYVAEAIDSILEQTFSDFELIIVDDGSQDRSLEIIREYERRDDRVRSLRQERNMGVSCARNRGIYDAAGDFVALMDSDDISLPTRLEKQLRFLQENPEIGALGVRSKIVNHDMKALLRVNGGPPAHASIVVSLFLGAVSFVTAAA